MSSYMKKPCQHCPFRVDVKPYLHPERAYEIANVAENPYSSFPCHKTTSRNDDGYLTERDTEKECAGMLTMRANSLGEESLPEGFVPSFEQCYSEPYDMYQAYEEAEEESRA